MTEDYWGSCIGFCMAAAPRKYANAAILAGLVMVANDIHVMVW